MNDVFVDKTTLKERTGGITENPANDKEDIYNARRVPYKEQKEMGLPKNRYC